jgi:hypothetical protein
MDRSVKEKFSNYPVDIVIVLHQIRDLILTVAKQEGIDEVEETLKWGEPSYITKMGSTIRFDYKENQPRQVCLYFNCKTTLIETFKEVYRDTFRYDGNRALIFEIGQPLPTKELSHCISMALGYKKLKHLHLLGA